MGMMRRREFLRAGALALAGARVPAARSRAAAPRVIVAGAGFAGSCCALELRRLNPALRVLLFDPNSRYFTCPMSNEAIVGLRTLASLAVERSHLASAGVEYS